MCAWKLCIDVVLDNKCDGQQLVRCTMKIYRTMQSSTDTLSLSSVQLSQKGRTEAPRCVRISVRCPFYIDIDHGCLWVGNKKELVGYACELPIGNRILGAFPLEKIKVLVIKLWSSDESLSDEYSG